MDELEYKILKLLQIKCQFIEKDLILYNLKNSENIFKNQNINPYVLYGFIEKKIDIQCFKINQEGNNMIIFEPYNIIFDDHGNIYCFLITITNLSYNEVYKQITNELVLFTKIRKYNDNIKYAKNIKYVRQDDINEEIKITLLTLNKFINLKKKLPKILKKNWIEGHCVKSEEKNNFIDIKIENNYIKKKIRKTNYNK